MFTHDIDSHHNFNVSNPCPFVPLPNGDDLETGTMARPDRPGAPKTDYEEVWRYLPFREGPDGPGCGISWILESEFEECPLGDGQHMITKVFLGRIWGTYLAFHQDQVHVVSQARLGNRDRDVKVTGGEVSALREEWAHGRWERKYSLGPNTGALPSLLQGIDDRSQESSWHAGVKVIVGGCRYVVRAFEHAAARTTMVFSRL